MERVLGRNLHVESEFEVKNKKIQSLEGKKYSLNTLSPTGRSKSKSPSVMSVKYEKE